MFLKAINKPGFYCRLLLVLILFSPKECSSQSIFITGPACASNGVQYQYVIAGSWSSQTSMSWCISGGIIAGSGSCKSGTPAPQIFVTWNTTGTGSITLNTSNPTGHATYTVSIAAALQPGSITGNQAQTITHNTIPAGINCSAASGGGCGSPTYVYQWQQSTDNVMYTPASGSTGLNVLFSSPLSQTTYLRRLVTSSEGTSGYSPFATVFVAPQLAGGSVASSNSVVNYGQSPGIINNSLFATGGNCSTSYGYQWQKSSDNINYTDIPSAFSAAYISPTIFAVTFFRRKVTCGSEITYSNVATINVNPQLFPGMISPSLFSIVSGTSPGILTGTLATGGGCTGSYTYQWLFSNNNSSFSIIPGATSLNYIPGNLATTAYYRRQVTCGTDVQVSNTVCVLVEPANSNVNYIRVRDIHKPGVVDSVSAAGLTNPVDVQQVTQYFDGIGRPVQNVAKQATPLLKDVVSFNLYDNYGREAVKYLPYPAISNDGNYKSTYLQDQNTFNTAQFSGEQYYYSKVNFEASPLNRVLSTFAPGLNWVGALRGAGTQFQVNAASDSVRNWSIAAAAGSIPASTATYSPGRLFKNITTDESNHQVIEYKDVQEKVILKKVQLAGSPGTAHVGWLCTYYIYDNMNNLRFVLQPRAVELIASNWILTQAIADELCFRYEYDARKRLIIKKVPGAGEVWMVYDMRDRLVMTQDNNLRPGKWMVTKYDTRNRPDSNGLLTDNNNRSYHQALANNSIFYPVTTTGFELLTQTFYDDYSWTSGTGVGNSIDNSKTGNNAYFITTYNTAPAYGVPITPYSSTKGMHTGSKTKVINSVSQYLYTVPFYDDRGRVIQVQSINYTGGLDKATTQYDFSGKPLRSLEQHQKNAINFQSHTLLTKLNYDAGGRLLTVYKNIDNAGSDQLIATNTYNELGQLQTKTLGNGLENLAYAYNIRGWLTSINKNYISGTATNYFGMELGYDKTTSVAGTTSYITPQYSGNIEGTVWKSKGDGIRRKYDFGYDNVNRITGASFLQNTSGSVWDKNYLDFSVNNLSYDANGNIMSMNQKGFKINGSILVDQLTYTYQTNSNKLSKVNDAANDPQSKLGDFHYTGTKQATDYSYDGNGNLIMDNNKAISTITYNYLNLPNKVTVTGKGNITYTFDASGNKIKKTTIEGAKTTTTLYIGGFVYQNDTLQFAGHEEGRARWAFHKYLNGNIKYGWEYDFFLKDHLGNIRMVLTQQKDTAQYIATMEAAYRKTENALFYNIPQSSYPRSGVSGYPTDNTTVPNDSLARVNGIAQKAGPSLLLRVMSGDIVDVATKSFYKSGGTNSTNNSVFNDLLNSLAGGIAGATSGSHGTLTDLSTSTSPLYGALNTFISTNNPNIAGKPKAYLNWILLDDQFKSVPGYPQSGAIVVGGPNVINTLAYSGIPVTRNGYLYIWVSNETQGWDVFFDNLSVKQYSGPITEETHYYPFGLTMAGISSRAAGGIQNRYKYNDATELQSGEFNDGSGLELYATNFRSLDPQLGRFWQLDPVDGLAQSNSLYSFACNNPISFNDPLGLWKDSTRTSGGEQAYANNPWNEPIIVTVPQKAFVFYYPEIRKDQGYWSDKMFVRQRDNKSLVQGDEPPWVLNNLDFYKNVYQNDIGYRQMQMVAVLILMSPMMLEMCPEIVSLANGTYKFTKNTYEASKLFLYEYGWLVRYLAGKNLTKLRVELGLGLGQILNKYLTNSQTQSLEKWGNNWTDPVDLYNKLKPLIELAQKIEKMDR